jgi:hypothetical protein
MDNAKGKFRTNTETAYARPALRGNAVAPRGAFAESAKIICAVLIAVFLGAASGLLIKSRWASAAASSGQPSSSLPPSGSRAADQKLSAPLNGVEQVNGDANDPPPAAAQAPPLSDLDGPLHAGGRRMSLGKTEDEGSKANVVRADTAHPTASEKRPPEKAEGDRNGDRSMESRLTAGRRQGDLCTLSSVTNSLTIYIGGSATITLSFGGATVTSPVRTSTPDWSDIAVFSESRTSGGLLKYSVRSVSNRAGVYRVIFRTPCGSRTIPVTVTRL